MPRAHKHPKMKFDLKRISYGIYYIFEQP